MRRIGSLFSGLGSLDMAAEVVFGGKVVWVSEVDKFANAVLERTYPDAINLGDITKINWPDQIRAAGNSVVTAQAVAATRIMLERAGWSV